MQNCAVYKGAIVFIDSRFRLVADRRIDLGGSFALTARPDALHRLEIARHVHAAELDLHSLRFLSLNCSATGLAGVCFQPRPPRGFCFDRLIAAREELLSSPQFVALSTHFELQSEQLFAPRYPFFRPLDSAAPGPDCTFDEIFQLMAEVLLPQVLESSLAMQLELSFARSLRARSGGDAPGEEMSFCSAHPSAGGQAPSPRVFFLHFLW